jgi:hypothetical protein
MYVIKINDIHHVFISLLSYFTNVTLLINLTQVINLLERQS